MSTGLLGTVPLWGAAASAALIALPLPGRWKRFLWVLSAALASAAVLVLGWALLEVDLSLAYVAQTTSRVTPWPYRLAALWGGMEGSMLFYAAMTVVVSAVAFATRAGDGASRVAALASAGLLSFTALLSDPFATLAIPAVDGPGLLAILQHPAMIYHPPILYLGLTSLVVLFALSYESAVVGRDPRRMQARRTWATSSWVLLTLGMLAGSNWAYVELGWGGFWAWDPVENTALMPWLALTGYLHTSRIEQGTGRLRRWSLALAMAPFALSVLGVYLTRSGVTGSIHSFAEDPVVGRVLLVAALAVAVFALTSALRADPGPAWAHGLALNRMAWLAANSGLMTLILVFVLVGSAYPAYAQVFFDESVAVGPGFYLATVFPLALILTVGLGLGLRARRGPSGASWVALGMTAAVVAGVVGFASGGRFARALGVGLGAAAITSLIAVPGRGRRVMPAWLAHLGMAVVIVAASASSLGGDFTASMRPGDSVSVAGRTVELLDISTGEADRYVYARAEFLVDGQHVMRPEIRGYEGQASPIAEPALRSTPLSDTIIATSLLLPDGETVDVSVFVRPLVWWVWVGALLMSAAGLVALLWRVGVAAGPRRRAREERLRAGRASGAVSR